MAAMKHLSIDLETFSSVNLSKSGVYRYVEADDFEILLFAYSTDGEPVKVIDLASGKKLPKEIISALTDPSITKWAFNAQFERICLSKYLGLPTGMYLSPKSWKCSMIWSAYMGLPLSLVGSGAVLGLEKQKLTKGKELIRYFCMPCTPTKSNGNRDRNLPSDSPEKWEMFKKYNIRDVEVEMQIQEKLRKFPVPESVWHEYHLDQEINDRGILLDMPFVKRCIEIDNVSRERLTAEIQELTELDNPNSVSQMKGWLADNGLKTDTLGKKAVADLMKEAPDNLAEVLDLRQQLAKSSVKKYQAMQNAVCKDGRARGMFQFYGANRTGRFCLTGDHEVLTDNGWVRLDEWEGGRIAVWNKDSEAVSFQNATSVSFDYEGPMYSYLDARIDQCSTPEHKMRVQRRYGGKWEDMTVEQMAKLRPVIPFTGYRYHRGCANPAWLRVLIMTQADGYYTSDGSIRFRFKKQRKIERCKMLLRKAEIPFLTYEYSGGISCISIPARAVPLWLREFRTKTFGYWLLDENPDIFFDELPNWDGYYPAPNSIQYTTTNKQNADIVQALAHMSGRCCSMKIKQREDKPEWKDAYVLNIWLTPGNHHEIRVKPEIKDYKGKVFCAMTTTGYFLIRRNGRVWVTGNSGRLIQLQNLPQNHMSDLAEARGLVRSGDYEALKMLYDDIPDTLSQMIRTAFIPEKGKRFIVADFSAIEARVIAWYAGEEWRNELFREGGDIYCRSASAMFGVPVEKHGINGHLRQKGKIAELACIAEGSLVLTDRGLVPIQDVTTDDLLWDGEAWVMHEGVIYKGEREVITYEGLTATSDHLVWVEGKDKPVQFGTAASRGAHLIKSGDGRNAIWLGENNIPGKAMERKAKPLLCSHRMHRVWCEKMDHSRCLEKWKIKGVSDVFSSKTDTEMAGQKAHISKAKMRKSFRSGLQKLRCKRYSIHIPECYRGWEVPNGDIWLACKGTGNRSYRYRWGLCSGESKICRTQGELYKSEKNCFNGILSRILAIFKTCCYKKIITGPESRADNPGCRTCSIRETKKLEAYRSTSRVYDIRNAGKHHRFTVSNCLVHNCGYGGAVGALKAMGALEMGLTEEELPELVQAWRASNPNIVRFWWDVDRAVKKSIKEKTTTRTHGIIFSSKSGMLFITLPSGRNLCYVKPRIGENRFGGESVNYEGVGSTKKWERIESYGPKFVENIVQATARDILMFSMQTLSKYDIVAHVHDEVIIEASPDVSLETVCDEMAVLPDWADGLILRADGYTCEFYQKD